MGIFDILSKGAGSAFKGARAAGGPALGGLAVLLLAGQIKDLIGELVDEDLSLKALFTGVGEEEEGRLTKKVKDIKQSRKKSKVTKELLREQFGAPKSAIDRAGPQLTDIVDIETIRKIIPFASKRGLNISDVLTEESTNESPIFNALRQKEQKAVLETKRLPVLTADQVMNSIQGG